SAPATPPHPTGHPPPPQSPPPASRPQPRAPPQQPPPQTNGKESPAMSESTRSSAGELVPVKFSRLSRRGVLLGLCPSQIVTLAVGVLTVVCALYAGGGTL